MATKSLLVILDLNIKGFSKSLKIATKQMSVSMKKMGASVSSLGKSLSASITLPATIAGVAMIKLASDADEVNNKFNEIFQKSAKQTGKELNKLAKSVGRNSTSLKEFAGDMGGILSSMQFTDAEAGVLSSSMIKLGIDVASFRNKSDAQVINAFSSALVGEREALKSLGVSILDADVKQEAFRLGLSKGKGALTKRATVLATVSLLQQRFSKDAGDAIRTQDGFANTLKKFNSTLKTMGETFGKLILPVALKFLNVLIPMIEKLTSLDTTTQAWVLGLIAAAAALGPVLIAIGAMSTGLGILLPVLGTIATAFITILAPLALVGVAVISVIGAWDDLLEGGKILWRGLISIFDTGGSSILDIFIFPFKTGFKLIKAAYDNFGLISQTFVQTVLDILVNLPIKMAKAVVQPFVNRMNEMLGLYNKVAKELGLTVFDIDPFKNFIPDVEVTFDDMKEISLSAFDFTKDQAEALFDTLAISGSQAMDNFQRNWSNGLKKIGLDTDSLQNKFKNLFGAGPSGTAPAGDAAPEKGGGVAEITQQEVGKGNVQKIDDSKTALQSFFAESQNISGQVDEMWANTFTNFADGASQSFAGALVEGENLAESMKKLMQDMVKDIIAQLIKMGIQWVISSAMASSASAAQTATVVTNNSLQAGSGAAASQASIPIVGPILALAAMGAMIAAVGALSGDIALANGGITTGPTRALIGEAGQEAVIPLDKLDGMMGAREQTIIMNLDGRLIARSVIKNAPKEIRLATGVLM